MLSSQHFFVVLRNTVDEGLYFNNIEKIMKTIAVASGTFFSLPLSNPSKTIAERNRLWDRDEYAPYPPGYYMR